MKATNRTIERPRRERAADGVKRATGRTRQEWFAVLDASGLAGRRYREIAGRLTGEHGLSKWWAQKLIVEYEQARGLRDPGVRRDGTFEVGASKTVAVPTRRAFDAFADATLRARWLPRGSIRVRDTDPGRRARFDWTAGGRVEVDVTARERGRSMVVVRHDRIADAVTAAEMKSYWRERMDALKALLEGSATAAEPKATRRHRAR